MYSAVAPAGWLMVLLSTLAGLTFDFCDVTLLIPL